MGDAMARLHALWLRLAREDAGEPHGPPRPVRSDVSLRHGRVAEKGDRRPGAEEETCEDLRHLAEGEPHGR